MLICRLLLALSLNLVMPVYVSSVGELIRLIRQRTGAGQIRYRLPVVKPQVGIGNLDLLFQAGEKVQGGTDLEGMDGFCPA